MISLWHNAVITAWQLSPSTCLSYFCCSKGICQWFSVWSGHCICQSGHPGHHLLQTKDAIFYHPFTTHDGKLNCHQQRMKLQKVGAKSETSDRQLFQPNWLGLVHQYCYSTRWAPNSTCTTESRLSWSTPDSTYCTYKGLAEVVESFLCLLQC